MDGRLSHLLWWEGQESQLQVVGTKEMGVSSLPWTLDAGAGIAIFKHHT